MIPNAVTLAEDLIRRRSITPNDDGCQDLLAEHLLARGFTRETFNREGVTNTWLRHGDAAPLFVFAGHTDVVPPGPENEWSSPPFEPTTRDGVLFGRGAADMKSGIAAMTAACLRFVDEQPQHAGSCALLLTSDEEGPAINGTRHVVEQLRARGDAPTWCIVGEPSSDKRLGDRVRIGRRGSLSALLTVHGVQGHVAEPGKALNPIHGILSALDALRQTNWGDSAPPFPPTSFQITEIHAGVGVGNVIPGQLQLNFNFRYSPPTTAEQLRARVGATLDAACQDTGQGATQGMALKYELEWAHSAEPFTTQNERLVAVTSEAIQDVVGGEPPRLSTGGGTSDGRFIAPLGCELLELGVPNATIHKINECARVDEIEQLSEIYLRILRRLLV